MARKYQLHGAFPSKAGDSAYEIAQKNGFEGTEEEWLASLVGPRGPQGPAGKDADLSGLVEAPETATVGQTIVVKEVDENGKPVLWEAADFPSGGGGSNNGCGVFDILTTLEEDANGVCLTAPVMWDKVLQYNIHITFPAGLDAQKDLRITVGGGQRAFSMKAGVIDINAYGLRYFRSHLSITVTSSAEFHGAAHPDIVNTNQSHFHNPVNDEYGFFFYNGGLIPSGTTIQAWGVYAL